MATTPTPTDGFTHWVIVTPTGDVIAWWADNDPQYDGHRSAHGLATAPDRAARARHDGDRWVVADSGPPPELSRILNRALGGQ